MGVRARVVPGLSSRGVCSYSHFQSAEVNGLSLDGRRCVDTHLLFQFKIIRLRKGLLKCFAMDALTLVGFLHERDQNIELVQKSDEIWKSLEGKKYSNLLG